MTSNEQAFLAQVALGCFTVDKEGRIWRHIVFHGGGAATPRWISPRRAERSSSRKGQYLRVMFRTRDGRQQVSAHRIVWMVHNRKVIPDGMEINHINGVKADNRPSNLERVTRKANAIHSVRVLGNKPKARLGADNSAAKVNEEAVRSIRRLAEGREMSQREIGEMFGLTQSGVSAIVRRKSWDHVV